MVLTDTLLAVVVSLVVLSLVLVWWLLRSKTRWTADNRALSLDPAAQAQLEGLANKLSAAGTHRTAASLLSEAVDLVREKYDTPAAS